MPGAGAYLFTATCAHGKTQHKFEAASPNALLTPIWLNLPAGAVELTCDALDAPGGKVIAPAGARRFEKGASFNGPYYQPELDYKASAELGLRGTFKQSYVRCWLASGKPDPGFPHYAYPSKTIGAVISGAAAYAQLQPPPPDANEMLEIGRKAADYLMSLHLPEGSPYEHFPPTYQGKQFAQAADPNGVMMIYPAEVAEAYLDLYEVIQDPKLLDAARRIVRTYARTQLPNSAWHLRVNVHTGKPTIKNLCTPTAIIHFLERLKTQPGTEDYDATIRKAVDYVMSGPVQTYNWNGQFEDGKGDAPTYRNLSRQEVCQLAGYLLEHSKDHAEYVDLAEELLRFAEDQFVVREVSPEHLSAEPNAQPRNPKMVQAHWITPSVLEQYNFYVPICRSMTMLLADYQQAHQVTGRRIYLEKAKAIAGALTVGQKMAMDKVDGQFPTLYSTQGEDGYLAKWINNAVYPAKCLGSFSRYLASLGQTGIAQPTTPARVTTNPGK